MITHAPCSYKNRFILCGFFLMVAAGLGMAQDYLLAPTDTLITTAYGGPSIDSTQYIGTTFVLQYNSCVTAVGGNIAGDGFAAILPLPSISSLPTNSQFPLTPSDVLTSVQYSGLIPGQDSTLALSTPVYLQAGVYALVFGGGGPLGALGSEGYGDAGGTPTGTQAADFVYVSSGNTGEYVFNERNGVRFFVEGTVVPEPNVSILLMVGAVLFTAAKRLGWA